MAMSPARRAVVRTPFHRPNLTLHVQDGEIVKATSPLDNTITAGNLCIKGRFGWRFVEAPPRTGD